ncbi:MAG: ATP-binding cassette domain-containing protein, partial [Pseudomonadota bacterium]
MFEAMSSREDAGPTAIDVSGVWKIFGENWQAAFSDIRTNGISKKEVLQKHHCVVGVADASFSVRQGEIFCVMGLSGSGKSTLVRHINRLLEPSAGKIVVDGSDVMALQPEALRQ